MKLYFIVFFINKKGLQSLRQIIIYILKGKITNYLR